MFRPFSFMNWIYAMYLVTFTDFPEQKFFAASLKPIAKYLHQWHGEDGKIVIEPSSNCQMTDNFLVKGELRATAQFLSSVERLL